MFFIRVINRLYCSQTSLKNELANLLHVERLRIKELRRSNPENRKVSGIKGYNGLVWESTQLDSQHGMLFRGYPIPHVLKSMPKLSNCSIPPAEAQFWLLITGQIPNQEQLQSLVSDWNQRAIVPFYVEKLIREYPPTMHPVKQLSGALNVLKSKFVESYTNGVFKEKYWEMVLDDVMDLIAKVPTVAALIYNKVYKNKMFLPMHNPDFDWMGNFANKLGINNSIFSDFLRLFMILYSDFTDLPENTIKLAGCALSDPYKSYASGLETLANDVAGFFAHQTIPFLLEVREQVGSPPKVEIIAEYLQNRTSIPGYDTIKFSKSDPRYEAMLDFVKKHLQSNDLCSFSFLVTKAISKKPSIDALTGVALQHFGIREYEFYLVLFAMARSLGLLSSYVWDRALGVPIENHHTKHNSCIPNVVIGERKISQPNRSWAERVKELSTNSNVS